MSNVAIDSDDADCDDRPDCTCFDMESDDDSKGRTICPIHNPATPVAFYTVAIYLIDRAYGGPEEGGWYYECGTRYDEQPENLLDGVPCTFRDEDKAIAYAAIINRWLDSYMNEGRPEISSVLSTGRYCAEVHPLYPPKHYPETRPRYE